MGFIGLRDYDPQHKAKPGYVRWLRNFRCESGVLSRRKGCRRFNSTSIGADPVRGVYVFYREALPPVVVVNQGGKLYRTDDATKAFTQIYDPLNTDLDVSFASYTGKLFASDGENRVLRWDGLGNSAEVVGTTDTPRGKYLLAIDNRLFQANLLENKNQVVWPNVGSSEEWEEDVNFANVDPFATYGPGDITGLKGFLGYPVVYKKAGIARLFATGTGYVVRTVTQGNGCVGPKTLVDTGDEHIYLGSQAVYRWKGGEPQDITSLLIPNAFGQIAMKYASEFVGVYHDSKYYLFYRPKWGGYSNNRGCLIFDTTINEWIANDILPFGVSCAVSRSNSSDNGDLLVGSQEDGTLWILESGDSDDGAAIVADAVMPHEDYGHPGVDKRFYRAYVHHERTGTNSLVLRHYCGSDETGGSGSFPLDGGASTYGGSTWGSAVYVGGRDKKRRYDLVNGSQNRTWGTNMSLRFQQVTGGAPARLHGYEVMYDDRGVS